MYYFFYIPVGTEARVRGTPWGTLAIASLNAGIFLFFRFVPGFEPEFYRLTLQPGDPSILTSITSSFLHAGWIHLLSNLLYFGIFAPPIESRIGTVRFLATYLCFAGLANLAQAGWMLAIRPDLASMAVIAIALWFLLQGVYQLVQPVEGTAYVAHLTGLATGALLGFLMGLAGEARLERRLVIGDRYAERGEWYAAVGEYEHYLTKRPEDPDVLIRAARVHRVTQQTHVAHARFRQAIARLLKRNEVDEACDCFDEMKRLLGDAPLPAPDLLRIARRFEERGRPSDASRAYESYGRHYPDAPGAVTALLKCVDIERKILNNPGRAQFVCKELLKLPLRPDLERLARERLHAVEEALLVQRGGDRRKSA
ncbi:MAG: hypothetical protein DMD86_18230 [Candidatus Rokuibacteriota bacterium]|nr:MAG: hypothetical protein DMD86_18230 [Candidatus Rokubacteria bacterium]